MKKLIPILALLMVVLFTAPAFAQTTGAWQTPPTVFSSTGTSTTASSAIGVVGTTACMVHLLSTSTSSANLDFEGSIDGVTYWYRLVRASNPTSTGELWAGPCPRYVRFNPSTHASGTLKGYVTWRSMPADPIGSTWKKLDVADAGSTFSLTSPTFGTSMVLDQSTGDYTLTWANPAAARAISIEDPGGSDVFVWKDATQTLTNKTFVAPILGAATATTVNKLTLTAPASAATLTIADGKTFTVNQTLTLTGTTGTTHTFPGTSSSVARIDAAQTFAGAQTFSGSQQKYATAKALVAATPTIFATVTVPSGGRIGGYLSYTIDADDSTDFQARSGVLPFSAVNKAGTITCTVGTVTTATEVVAVSTGTLTNTFTCADATGNVMNLLANAASSLTETTLEIRPFVTTTGAATVTYP